MLKGRTRRALDSTLLDDAVATQDTVTQLVSAIRRVRRVVPEAAAVAVAAHDYDASGKPVCAWDDPVAKAALVTGLVNDARAIIDALEGVELDAERADAVGLLALVAGQDVEPGDDEGTWRIAQRVAPDRVISTVDPEARHMHKSRSEYRDGYKAHVAVEPETGLITAAALTPANAGDGPTGVALLAGEEPGLQVLADSAYGSGRSASRCAKPSTPQPIKAIPLRRPIPGGFDRDDFIIDHAARTATCPAGHTVHHHRPKATRRSGRAATAARSGRAAPPPSDGTRLTIHRTRRRARRRPPRLARAATSPTTTDNGGPWSNAPSPGSSPSGNRRVRYRGVDRNQHGLALRVAAINLRRLVNLGLTTTELGPRPKRPRGQATNDLQHKATSAAGSHPRTPALRWLLTAQGSSPSTARAAPGRASRGSRPTGWCPHPTRRGRRGVCASGPRARVGRQRAQPGRA